MVGKVISYLTKTVEKSSGKITKSGKPNLPRFLYHITSKKNYESMLKSGEIRTSHDAYLDSNLEGVFMFDLKNFAKRWTSTFFKFKEADEKFNLGSALVCKNSDIVLLKVPTRKMNVDKLKIRVQDDTKVNYHTLNGDSAKFQTLYTRRKKPIEYIYNQNIDISDVQKIGEVNLNINLDNRSELIEFMQKRPFETLLKLFNGTPEEKCVQKMQKAKIKEQCYEITV